MKQFVKDIKRDYQSFLQVKMKFPRYSDAKIKEGFLSGLKSERL